MSSDQESPESAKSIARLEKLLIEWAEGIAQELERDAEYQDTLAYGLYSAYLKTCFTEQAVAMRRAAGIVRRRISTVTKP